MKTSGGAGVLHVLHSRVQKHTLLKQENADPEKLHSCFSDNATNINNYMLQENSSWRRWLPDDIGCILRAL